MCYCIYKLIYPHPRPVATCSMYYFDSQKSYYVIFIFNLFLLAHRCKQLPYILFYNCSKEFLLKHRYAYKQFLKKTWVTPLYKNLYQESWINFGKGFLRYHYTNFVCEMRWISKICIFTLARELLPSRFMKLNLWYRGFLTHFYS